MQPLQRKLLSGTLHFPSELFSVTRTVAVALVSVDNINSECKLKSSVVILHLFPLVEHGRLLVKLKTTNP